ncbi:hypothetical protein A2U01_0087981, partial [Trifolium medium]|nr:hypothetical protein [Trifolium medium]
MGAAAGCISDSASERAQAGQDLEDDIMDLQNRELNPMFFT